MGAPVSTTPVTIIKILNSKYKCLKDITKIVWLIASNADIKRLTKQEGGYADPKALGVNLFMAVAAKAA